jgi:hypothetical protein
VLRSSASRPAHHLMRQILNKAGISAGRQRMNELANKCQQWRIQCEIY